MVLCRCSASYQLNTSKATDPQSVDDVEVSEVEVEEKRILCFIPAVAGNRLEMKSRMEEEIIHFQQPGTKYLSLV